MKITAQDLLELGVIDEIVPEPVGGAHRDADSAIQRTGDAIRKNSPASSTEWARPRCDVNGMSASLRSAARCSRTGAAHRALNLRN